MISQVFEIFRKMKISDFFRKFSFFVFPREGGKRRREEEKKRRREEEKRVERRKKREKRRE